MDKNLQKAMDEYLEALNSLVIDLQLLNGEVIKINKQAKESLASLQKLFPKK